MRRQAALQVEMARVLDELGIAQLDMGIVQGTAYKPTHAIARWAYEYGYRGIAYASHLGGGLSCWAVFEGAGFEPVGPSRPITRDDVDLAEVARRFGLRL